MDLSSILNYSDIIVFIGFYLVLTILNVLGVFEKLKPLSSPYRNRLRILTEMTRSSKLYEESLLNKKTKDIPSKDMAKFYVFTYLSSIPIVYFAIFYRHTGMPSSDLDSLLANAAILFFAFSLIPTFIEYTIDDKFRKVKLEDLKTNHKKYAQSN